jgi:Inner membrane protein YgaP-like, transmembrane domain
MRIPFTHGPATVGREDRLVRSCVALSLLLLAGFAVAMSGRPSPVSIMFLALGLFFSVTAVLGRDPLYAHFGIDTRSDSELAGHESQDQQAPVTTTVVDLRGSRAPHDQRPTTPRSGSDRHQP